MEFLDFFTCFFQIFSRRINPTIAKLNRIIVLIGTKAQVEWYPMRLIFEASAGNSVKMPPIAVPNDKTIRNAV